MIRLTAAFAAATLLLSSLLPAPSSKASACISSHLALAAILHPLLLVAFRGDISRNTYYLC